MTDFIELVSSATGKRVIVNAVNVLLIAESNIGKASIYLTQAVDEDDCIVPQETYEQIRACLNPVERNR